MPTPMFKVLAQSLRLGQPPDATTAVRVLVECIEKQSLEIEDLRAKLAVASSRIQYAEARLGRLLEATEGGEHARFDDAPPSSHLPAHQHPHAAAHHAPQPDSARGSQRPPPMPGPLSGPLSGPMPGQVGAPQQAMPQQAQAQMPPQSAQPGAQRSPSQRPQAIPHALPIPQAPVHVQQAGPPPGAPVIPRAPTVPVVSIPDDLADLADESDPFNTTLVISKRDIQQVAKAEAPFPIGRVADRKRANTSGLPFHQPPLAPPPPPAPAQAAQQLAAQQPGQLPQPGPPHVPMIEDMPPRSRVMHEPSVEQPVPSSQPIDGNRTNALADLVDEVEEGGTDDFTLTDQTARVNLSGLTELEERAGLRHPGARSDRDGD